MLGGNRFYEKLMWGRGRGNVRGDGSQLVTLNMVAIEDPTMMVPHEHLDQVRGRAMGTSAGRAFRETRKGAVVASCLACSQNSKETSGRSGISQGESSKRS